MVMSTALAEATAGARTDGLTLFTGTPSQRDSHSREMCCPAMSRWHALSLPSTSESDGGMDAGPATTEAWLS